MSNYTCGYCHGNACVRYLDVIIALYQTCISDLKGQSVDKFYIYWCNWRSLKPFLSRVILTHKNDDDYGQITVWERELRALMPLHLRHFSTQMSSST